MVAAWKVRLDLGCAALNITLSEDQKERLLRYIALTTS